MFFAHEWLLFLLSFTRFVKSHNTKGMQQLNISKIVYSTLRLHVFLVGYTDSELVTIMCVKSWKKTM